MVTALLYPYTEHLEVLDSRTGVREQRAGGLMESEYPASAVRVGEKPDKPP